MDGSRRNTRQRQAVLEELRKVSSHPTAAELYEMTRRRLPRISMGTVYRNLDLLARMGEISKLEMGASEARFDGNPSRHDHIRCTRCGRVDDAPDLGAKSVVPEVTRLCGYDVLGFRLEFVGVCPQCQDRGTSTGDGAPRTDPAPGG